MVGPHHGQARVAVQRDLLGVLGRQAGDRRLDHQPDVAPVPLQPHDARLDGGEVEQVVDQPAEARGLRRDPVQETLLGVAVPGHVRLQEAGRVAPDGGQRRAQLVAEPGQESALKLARSSQGRGFLVRVRGLLAFQRKPQRIRRVLHQRGLLLGRRNPPPAGQQHGGPADRHEPHRPGPVAAAAAQLPGHAVRMCAGQRVRGHLPQRARGRGGVGAVRPGVGAPGGLLPGGLGDQRDLLGLQAAAQRLDRQRQSLAGLDRAGQRLQHLPDRLEHPVPGRHLVQQPVPFDRAGGVARVDGDQVELVPLGRAVLGAEDRDHAAEPARAEHRDRPRAGHADRLGEVAEAPPGRAGPDVIGNHRAFVGRGQAHRATAGAERQPVPRSQLAGGEAEGRGTEQGPVADQVNAQPLGAERRAERGQDQRQARARVGAHQAVCQPVQPGELAAGGGVDRLTGQQRDHVVRVRVGRAQVSEDPALAQHHDAVGEPEHLVDVVAGEQDRGALLAQVHDQLFDLSRFLDTQARGRLVQD